MATSIEINPAYTNLNDSILQAPTDPSLYLRRAMRLTQENKHELAYPDFLKAFSLQPEPGNALPFAANLEILGKYGERLHLLEFLDQHSPGNSQVSRLLADAYISAGKQNLALSMYNGLIAKDSLDPEIWYEKAMLLSQLKDTSGSVNCLVKAYRLQGVATYGLELAHLYAEQKNPRAIEICDRILRQDSAGLMIDPFFIKGIYYSNIKSYAKAIVQFDSCIQRDWKTTDAYLEKGRIYFQTGNLDEAAKTFNMAITVTNTDPDAYFWLGRCYEALHRNMDALSNYRKAVSLDKDFTEARKRMEDLDKGFAHPSH